MPINFNPADALDKKLEDANLIRLGFQTLLDASSSNGHVTVVNTALSEFFNTCSDADGVAFLTILSQAYAFWKANLEVKRKIKIAEEVKRREERKLKEVEDLRNGQGAEKAVRERKSAETTRVEYSANSVEDKAIKEMIKLMKCTPEIAVETLKSMGAISKDFELSK